MTDETEATLEELEHAGRRITEQIMTLHKRLDVCNQDARRIQVQINVLNAQRAGIGMHIHRSRYDPDNDFKGMDQ